MTLASALAATVYVQPAAASCATSTELRPAAGVVTAGTAVARDLFLTVVDPRTMRHGGPIAPPDVASPLAQSALDRAGVGSALAGQFYSPYNDPAGAELPDRIGPGRVKLSSGRRRTAPRVCGWPRPPPTRRASPRRRSCASARCGR